MRTIGNIHEDVKIDKFNLMDENAIQPMMYEYYAEVYNDLKTQKAKVEAQLELVVSQKKLQYKRNPPDDIKITDSTLDALVTMDADVQEVKQKLLQVVAELNVASTAFFSIAQRTSSLDNMTKLANGTYYTEQKSHNGTYSHNEIDSYTATRDEILNHLED